MSTYETLVVVGMALWILVALSLLAGIVYFAFLFRGGRKALHRVAELLEGAEDRIAPVLRNVERASEDVNYIVAAVRADVGDVGDTVRRVTESTNRMLATAEERVAEINGLLEVVQEEAENTFLSTASLLRGIRGGREAAEAERRRAALRDRRYAE